MKNVLPVVPSEVVTLTLKGNLMGQAIIGLHTIAHASTTPTSSETW